MANFTVDFQFKFPREYKRTGFFNLVKLVKIIHPWQATTDLQYFNNKFKVRNFTVHSLQCMYLNVDI